jgi:hypothetical protein
MDNKHLVIGEEDYVVLYDNIKQAYEKINRDVISSFKVEFESKCRSQMLVAINEMLESFRTMIDTNMKTLFQATYDKYNAEYCEIFRKELDKIYSDHKSRIMAESLNRVIIQNYIPAATDDKLPETKPALKRQDANVFLSSAEIKKPYISGSGDNNGPIIIPPQATMPPPIPSSIPNPPVVIPVGKPMTQIQMMMLMNKK